MEDTYQLIGRNIALFRDAKKWSLVEVARKMEEEQHFYISVVELCAYEQGRKIGAEELHRIARVLRVDVNELFEDSPLFL